MKLSFRHQKIFDRVRSHYILFTIFHDPAETYN